MDKWLNNTNVIRVAALLIGILLWFIVHLDEQIGPDSTLLKDQMGESWIYDVNVTVIGLNSEAYVLRSIYPETTNIRIQGKTRDLAKVSTEDGKSRIIADLTNIEAGTHQIRLRAQGFPDGVQVIDMNPSSVSVVIEQVQKKEVPIEVRITGEPAEGYKVGEPIVSPSRVIVSAPETTLTTIQSVRAVVDVTGANKAVKGEYKLVAIDKAGREVNVPIVPAAANVEVPITVPFKTVPLQIRLSGAPPPGYSIAGYRQSENQVTIYGPEEVLNRIEIYDALEIDLSNATEDIRRTIELPLKDGLDSIHPTTVDVHVEVMLSVSKTIDQVPIRFSGLNEEWITDFSEPDEGLASVTVEGAPSQIGSLMAEQIELVVDVSNLPPGEHRREIRVHLPVFVKLKSIEPTHVTVVVRESKDEETVVPPIIEDAPPNVEDPLPEEDVPAMEQPDRTHSEDETDTSGDDP